MVPLSLLIPVPVVVILLLTVKLPAEATKSPVLVVIDPFTVKVPDVTFKSPVVIVKPPVVSMEAQLMAAFAAVIFPDATFKSPAVTVKPPAVDIWPVVVMDLQIKSLSAHWSDAAADPVAPCNPGAPAGTFDFLTAAKIATDTAANASTKVIPVITSRSANIRLN